MFTLKDEQKRLVIDAIRVAMNYHDNAAADKRKFGDIATYESENPKINKERKHAHIKRARAYGSEVIRHKQTNERLFKLLTELEQL